MQKTYYIATMGCQMNEYDSDYMGRLLQEACYMPVGVPERADLVVINTCAVREKAEQKAFSLLGRMFSLKQRRPGMILGIMGCVAQKNGKALLERYPDLDLVLGTRELARFKEILKELQKGKIKVAATELSRGTAPAALKEGFFKGRVKGFITIMEGCNNFCTYCVVPYVRGREVSRPPHEIIREAEYLVKEGIKEITLLGQNVNSYLHHEKDVTGFADLLRVLQGTEGLRRIRFTTSHPKDLSPELIRSFSELDKLCSHVHLPFQAGSNRVLDAMNRGYTRETYMELVGKLRRIREDIAVTGDVMVGFPGETREDFHLTLDLIKRVEFDGLYSFKYSDREGTRAAGFANKIPEDEKLGRLSELQELQKSITLKKNREMIGKETVILVEGKSRKGKQLTGRTSNNKIVNFMHDEDLIGHFVKVLIIDSHANSLLGEIVRRPENREERKLTADR
ncbi:MAG: tRNA (N6-isopentenyl adenosine(37)-C2)-methylthiotransferase MiaB [Candidatus Desulfacyla sp.]